MNEKIDLGVIGAGPGGYTAAIAAAKAGLRTVIFESGRAGGTCLNVGCIPTKYLLSAADDLERIRGMEDGGMLRSSGEFSFKAIRRNMDAAVEKIVSGVDSLLRTAGVERAQGTAVLMRGNAVACGDKVYACKNVIIATGSEPVIPKIPGAEFMGTSTDALALRKVPGRLVCVGAGVIGLEMASAFSSFGSEVTVIEAMPGICGNELPAASALLRSSLEARSITILTDTRLKSVDKADNSYIVSYESGGTIKKAEADFVLCAVGRRPCLRGIDAQALGLSLNERGGISVDARMRTSLDGVYAIGDCTGGTMLAHNAYAMAETAAADILGSPSEYRSLVIPRCIYTRPGLASVGMNEEQARAKGFKPVVGKSLYSHSGMATASRDGDGCVFCVCDKQSTRTLGFFIVGHAAHELIDAAAMAVGHRFTREDWLRHVPAHPTLSEMLKEAALDATK